MKVDIDADLPDGSTVQVWALQDSWMVHKAYQLAYDTFKDNSSQESGYLTGTNKARWHDFRVAAGFATGATTVDSIPAGFNGPSSPISPQLYTSGEYEFTEVADASGNSKTFRWVGTSATTFNIIDEYDATGDTQQTPTFAQTTVAYDGLDDELDSNQLEHLSEAGDNAPYDDRVMENQVWMLVGTLHIDATGTSKLSTGFFCAPAGIYALQLSGVDGNTINGKISVEAKAGDYKGVHGQPMLEL